MTKHTRSRKAVRHGQLRGLAGLATGALLLLVVWMPSTALGEPQMVTLCHAAGQEDTENWTTLTISYQAAYGQAGHFNEDGTPQAGHEADYLGPCVTDETTTTAAPATTTTAPPGSSTTTTAPASTTTTSAPATTTTTADSTTTTEASTTSTTAASSTTTTTADSTTTTEIIALVTSTLPLTGVDTGSVAMLALSLMAAGTVAILFGRTPAND